MNQGGVNRRNMAQTHESPKEYKKEIRIKRGHLIDQMAHIQTKGNGVGPLES